MWRTLLQVIVVYIASSACGIFIKMRILFFGATRGTACSLYYFTSFIKLGHSALPFDPEYFESKHLFERLQIRFRKGPTIRKVRAVGESLIRLIQENKFDIVFNMAENFLESDTIEEIRKTVSPAPLFLYHSHDNNFSDGIMKPPSFFKSLACYDHVFTTKSQNVAKYEALGCPSAHFIPSAYETTVHAPVENRYSRYREKHFPVSFIGTFDQSRIKFVEAIGWNDLHVWGSHWQRYPGISTSQGHITPHPIYFFEFSDVIGHSQINLGLLREEAEDLHTQRTFEIPACGGFQLSPRTEEILRFFKENEEIVCFDSLEEMKDKIRFYLKADTEREKIRRKGHERCLGGKNSYVDRVAEILEIATQRLSLARTRSTARQI